MKENTLAYKMLKARYFPQNDFMEAPIGTNPSYLWRSLREGHHVLKRGLIWRIGDGKNISVRRDCWISYKSPRPVMICDDAIDDSMRVI
ncbi:Uncharacterized protein TCM_004559 [Theobroma cacao]|uniref:Uncharacterized protein n=1 Tax=Theobroma cacao TaxID=3641 RepID=A0A061DRC1_THECC|nr:Uncharacterized protein TCM_004559 [Theobroma cacao]